MTVITHSQFLRFLREELALPETSIDLALRHEEQDLRLLPMVLWKYGLVTLKQLDTIYDWLASHHIEEATVPLQNLSESV
ncbi:DUF2949 domain-containing protein [Oscillatoria sp. CS-180]|uniref:DUF2949 domain-containing protein n=1 Tax=Oscillatoria sp. CS-180 TaxID=3021720 RepID=UPI00232D40BD|nr:DUF2949 domain-containing protein [Oscillatoria sp. CS-180]MDB9529743.1 DUF2949 domain-containing protein [Oscillatoria sp. CS-180]